MGDLVTTIASTWQETLFLWGENETRCTNHLNSCQTNRDLHDLKKITLTSNVENVFYEKEKSRIYTKVLRAGSCLNSVYNIHLNDEGSLLILNNDPAQKQKRVERESEGHPT